MAQSESQKSESPYLRANPLSRLLLWWLNPLFSKGYGKTLEADDLFDVCPADQSNTLGDKLEREWRYEEERVKCQKGTASLERVLFRLFGKEYLLLGLLLVIREAAKISQPLILGHLIRYFNPDTTVAEWEAYTYALAMTLCALVLVLTFHPYVYHVMRMGMRIRIACNSLMYRKSLRLSSAGLSQTTPGQLINLMSNDVGKFDYAFVRMMYLILGPIDAIVIHILLWQILGPSVLAGFAVLVLLIPVQILMGKMVSKFTLKIARHTDERVRMMNEIIAGIQVIKLYCWEKPFGEWVSNLRRLETDQVRNLGYVRAVSTGPFFISAKLMALAVFVTYRLIGGVVTAEPVFVAMSMYESVRLSATSYVCYAITQLSEVRVAIKRIETFLQLPEKEEDLKFFPKPETNTCKAKDTGVTLKCVSASWDKTNGYPTLDSISASVGPAKLLIVIGPVGSGKSSLLMTILGELPVSTGDVTVRGHVSYTSQEPWVFSGTLRQNITLGKPFIQDKYDAVLNACALKKDMSMMSYGDMTLIGDRGTRLSGGQRARISLARALYTDGDIYLLDDPLSSVDAAVGRHIFKHIIKGVLKDKPRILITHHHHFLKYADEILVLNQGKVVNKGSYNDLTASGMDLKSFLRHDREPDDTSMLADFTQSFTISTTPRTVRSRRFSRQESTISATSLKENDGFDVIEEETESEEHEQEQQQEGSVDWKVYFTYFLAGFGLLSGLLFIAVCASVAGTYVMSDYWLTIWSQQEKKPSTDYSNSTSNETDGHPYFHVAVYSGLIGGVFILELIKALFFFKIAVDSSRNLHDTMLTKVLRTNIAFFATNTSGRILNRFSKDVGLIDNRIPDLIFNILQCSLLIISMVVVVGVVNPWTFIPVLPICILLVVVRRFYLKTSRDIFRLEGIARSPIYSHVSSSMDGLTTLRTSRAQKHFIDAFDAHQDAHTRAYFLLIGTTTWLGIRLDCLSAVFLSAVTFCCVLASNSLGQGLVGLTMTYAITGTGIFQWTVKSSADLENQMIAVERVRDYSKLPAETTEHESSHLDPKWPEHGSIQAETLNLKYHTDAPLVLKDLSFSIKPKEKIGIVGRSGAGKSSLITALFRLVEPEGTLCIDGVDIRSIGLQHLRRHISIIPQDPVLFKGNLRRNIDPLSQYTDSSLWNVLKEVELQETFAKFANGLETEVSEGGSNFSIGERQLVCLARALLRHNKILVIDEATANVDHRTDRLIQKTVREKFRDYTVLTVAHRLHTVIDSDKIMVLEQGNIVEFDSPYHLLNKRDGFLYRMVHQLGTSEAERLTEEARRTHELRTGAIIQEEKALKESTISFYLPHEDLKTIEDTDEVNVESVNTKL